MSYINIDVRVFGLVDVYDTGNYGNHRPDNRMFPWIFGYRSGTNTGEWTRLQVDTSTFDLIIYLLIVDTAVTVTDPICIQII